MTWGRVVQYDFPFCCVADYVSRSPLGILENRLVFSLSLLFFLLFSHASVSPSLSSFCFLVSPLNNFLPFFSLQHFLLSLLRRSNFSHIISLFITFLVFHASVSSLFSSFFILPSLLYPPPSFLWPVFTITSFASFYVNPVLYSAVLLSFLLLSLHQFPLLCVLSLDASFSFSCLSSFFFFFDQLCLFLKNPFIFTFFLFSFHIHFFSIFY